MSVLCWRYLVHFCGRREASKIRLELYAGLELDSSLETRTSGWEAGGRARVSGGREPCTNIADQLISPSRSLPSFVRVRLTGLEGHLGKVSITPIGPHFDCSCH